MMRYAKAAEHPLSCLPFELQTSLELCSKFRRKAFTRLSESRLKSFSLLYR